MLGSRCDLALGMRDRCSVVSGPPNVKALRVPGFPHLAHAADCDTADDKVERDRDSDQDCQLCAAARCIADAVRVDGQIDPGLFGCGRGIVDRRVGGRGPGRRRRRLLDKYRSGGLWCGERRRRADGSGQRCRRKGWRWHSIIDPYRAGKAKVIVAIFAMYFDQELIGTVRQGPGVPHRELSVVDCRFAAVKKGPLSSRVRTGSPADLVPGKVGVRRRSLDCDLTTSLASVGR